MKPLADALGKGLPVLTCLVIDRHIRVGKAVGGLLGELCSLELVAVFSSVAQALVFIENPPPDLLLLDVYCAGDHGETWIDAALALKAS